MHGKSHAESWQRYIREALGKALSRRSAWFLFGLAFLVVYREAFETILFFAALAAQGRGRSEEHTSELQSLMRISYAVFCLKKKKHLLQHYLLSNINTLSSTTQPL